MDTKEEDKQSQPITAPKHAAQLHHGPHGSWIWRKNRWWPLQLQPPATSQLRLQVQAAPTQAASSSLPCPSSPTPTQSIQWPSSAPAVSPHALPALPGPAPSTTRCSAPRRIDGRYCWGAGKERRRLFPCRADATTTRPRSPLALLSSVWIWFYPLPTLRRRPRPPGLSHEPDRRAPCLVSPRRRDGRRRGDAAGAEEQGQKETAAAGGAREEGLQRQRGQVPHALAGLPRPAAGEWRQSRRFLLRPTIFSPFAIFMPLYCFELFLLWVHRRLDCWIPRAIPLFRLLVLVILFCRGTGIQELHRIAWSSPTIKYICDYT